MRSRLLRVIALLAIGTASSLRGGPLPGSPGAAEAARDSWQRAIGPWDWKFPRDHGAHPGFKSEWWYFTGNLQDARHRPFGYQLTIFRQGVQFQPAQPKSRWGVRDFYFGHLTISDIAANQFHFEERVSRGALGEAGAGTDHMNVKLGSWTIQQQGAQEDYKLFAHAGDLELSLEERPAKPLILEGVHGLSQKDEGAGNASYYYSYPRLTTAGDLHIGGATYHVTGQSWFDHEFSTGSLGPTQVGWDWFCIQLDSREEIMLYVMRDKAGAIVSVSEGTWVRPDGTSERLPPGSFTVTKTSTWTSHGSGATYPAGWRILIPGHKADLTVTPAIADQELRLDKMGVLDYWEGACSTTGSVDGVQVTGVGYTELTGYAGALRTSLEK